MKRVLPGLWILVLALVFGGSALAGDIFVYKGTFRFRGGLELVNSGLPPSGRIFRVVDFDTGQARDLLVYVKDGRKYRPSNNFFNVTRLILANGKSATAMGYSASPTVFPEPFQVGATVFQGTDVSLKIESTPTIRYVSRPRAFVGRVVSVGEANGGYFRFGDYSLTLQSAMTIAANDNNKGLDTVFDELLAALVAQGYQLP